MQFLETEAPEYRNFSEETAQLIDAEILALVTEGENRAQQIITGHKPALEKLAGVLLEKEVISREEMLAIIVK